VSIKNNNSSSAILEITATVENGSINTRSGDFTLVSDNGDEYKITVTQQGSTPYSNVRIKDFEVGIDGGSLTTDLIANWGASWSVSGLPD
jgi:hypothetical protein